MKFKYIIVSENSLDKFDIGQCQGQGHGVTCRNFSAFTAIQTVNSTLAQARKLTLSVYVYLIIIYK